MSTARTRSSQRYLSSTNRQETQRRRNRTRVHGKSITLEIENDYIEMGRSWQQSYDSDCAAPEPWSARALTLRSSSKPRRRQSNLRHDDDAQRGSLNSPVFLFLSIVRPALHCTATLNYRAESRTVHSLSRPLYDMIRVAFTAFFSLSFHLLLPRAYTSFLIRERLVGFPLTSSCLHAELAPIPTHSISSRSPWQWENASDRAPLSLCLSHSTFLSSQEKQSWINHQY
jgi:hypothetical protein